jgi:folate-binding protein YgfZ
MNTTALPTRLTGVARLDTLGVIRAQGPEAAKFLQGQLTQDFALLGLSEGRLAAFCSPKGRMLASFVGFKRSHDEILLVCRRDLLAPTLKRLSMFVLRAQLRLSDSSDAFAIWGVAGEAEPSLSAAPWSHVATEDGASWTRLYPAEGVPRALCVMPFAEGATVEAPAGQLLETGVWDWLEVMSGVATLSQPVVEAFVPQMLNYESVGGVNFKKGCYPGQEVVARSQFRGTLKRRAYRVAADAPLSVGQEVFHDSDASQPCGTVAAAAENPAGGWNAIVSMQVSAAQSGRLTASAPDGPVLQLLPLPYPLLDDI